MPAEELDDLPGTKPDANPAPEAKKPAKQQPDEPAKQTHSDRLVKLATDMGFSQRDLDTHTSAEIWDEIERIRELEAATRRPEPPKQQVEKKPDVDEDEEYLEELAAHPETDQKLVKFLKKLHAKGKLADKVTELEQRDQQREQTRHFDMLETAFALLPKKYLPLIGEGSILEVTDPGARGWRQAVYAEAKIKPGDTQRAMNKKVLDAITKLAAGKVKDEEEEEEEPANPYEAPKSKKKKDIEKPRDAEGRFTADDFERGHVAKPSGKKIDAENLTAVEATRQYLRQNGDARGFRPSISFDDDDLPG